MLQAEFFRGNPSGAHPPPVNREGSRNGHDEFAPPGRLAFGLCLRHRLAVPPDRAVAGLETRQPPCRLHEQVPQRRIAVLGDGTLVRPSPEECSPGINPVWLPTYMR